MPSPREAEKDSPHDQMCIRDRISPGNSGGPVILRDGTVIGITTMGLKVGQNLNFAIAAAEVIAAGFFDPGRMKSQPLKNKP